MKRLRQRFARLDMTLWTLIVPPATWAAHFLFSYLWAAIYCAKVGDFDRFPTLFVIGTVLALVVIIGAGWIAHVQANVPGSPPPHERSTDSDRLRFLAKSTQLLAGLSFVAVVFTALPVIFIGDCR